PRWPWERVTYSTSSPPEAEPCWPRSSPPARRSPRFARWSAQNIPATSGLHTCEHGKALPGVQALKEKELLTLADYMSFNLPLPAAKVPANAAKANWSTLLPIDGRDMALEYC